MMKLRIFWRGGAKESCKQRSYLPELIIRRRISRDHVVSFGNPGNGDWGAVGLVSHWRTRLPGELESSCSEKTECFEVDSERSQKIEKGGWGAELGAFRGFAQEVQRVYGQRKPLALPCYNKTVRSMFQITR